MTSLLIALALLQDPSSPTPAPSWFGGRIVTTDDLHVGIRPAAFVDNENGIEWGIGATVQVTVDAL